MARIRIRMTLNEGGVGVRFHKLAEVAQEFEKLFRYLADDLGVSSGTDDWVAREFGNGSVSYDVELSKPVDDSVIPTYNRYVSTLTDFKEDSPPLDSRLSTRTLKQFVSAGKILEADEAIKLGLYQNGKGKPELVKSLIRSTSLELERILEKPIEYVGTVQGKTGTHYKGSDYFDLREPIFGEIVKCYYSKDLYPRILEAYRERDAIVHVAGTIKSNRIEKRPLEVRVTDIAVYAPLSDKEFKKFYGIAPKMTGDESTGDYIARIRDDGGQT